MRIPIREQLGAIVLLSTLIGLAVVTVATWIVNYNFVLDIRSSGLSLTASLKAAQLASSLQLMQTSVKALSTRVRLQTALQRYYEGNNTYENWYNTIVDFEDALESSPITLTTTVVHNNYTLADNKTALLNVTSAGIGSGYLFPPELNPNITYGSQPVNATFNRTLAFYHGRQLSANSAVLLGPQFINDTFCLFSLTTPVINSTTLDIVGWITVQLSTKPISDVINSPEGLDKTGTVLLIGPATNDNRFPGSLWSSSLPITNASALSASAKARFVLPPAESQYTDKRHIHNSTHFEFNIGQYSAVYQDSTRDLGTINNAGSDIATFNEEGNEVSVGFAVPRCSFVAWILVVEQARDEVWEPIRHLRTILLACVFGTAGAMLLFIWPTAHFASLPIRRLREATERSVHPHMFHGKDLGSPTSQRATEKRLDHVETNEKDHSSSPEPGPEPKPNEHPPPGRDSWWTKLSSYFVKSRLKVDSDAARDEESSIKSFKIPSKVKDGKHFIKDELTDLTTTFNEMSDELVMQYAKLEDRVRMRTAELEHSKKAAEAANESKTLFIANISHELKTPLNGILGMCAVSMQEDDYTKIKRSLGLIYKSGDLLHNLLTDLLTFSKNQVGQNLSLDQREFHLHDISSQLKAIFSNQAKESNVDFSIRYAGPCDSLGGTKPEEELSSESEVDNSKRYVYAPNGLGKVRNMTLWGDQHRILQIAINLVSNGLKFTPAEGRVTLTIRCLTVSEQPPSRKSSTQSLASKRRTGRNSRTRSRREVSSLRSDSLHERNVGTALEINPMEKRGRTSHTNLSNRSPSPPATATTIWFEFEIEDTGPGIAEHLQDQIFEPFVQGDLRLTKKFGGTGLGLSICSQLASLMKGSIYLESELGKGSKFTLRIPLKHLGSRPDSDSLYTASRTNSVSGEPLPPQKDRESPESPPVDPEEASVNAAIPFESTDPKPRLVGLSQPFFSKANPPLGSPEGVEVKKENRLRVLVAEDNKVNQEVVLRMLRLEDVFDVHIAKDGQEALDMVKESMKANQPYHLIFMDVQMPNLDGRQSTRLIREIGYSAPIVALTAFADEVNQKECMDSGMDYFLAKPIRRPALKHVLKTYCPPIEEVEEAESAGLTTVKNPFDTAANKTNTGLSDTGLDSTEGVPAAGTDPDESPAISPGH